MPLNFSSNRFKENPYSIPFGSWRLYECYLVPTRENLEAFSENEAKSEEENPFIDVFLLKETSSNAPSSSSLEGHRLLYLEKPHRIRKLHLQSVGGPLQMMFMHSTKENAENVVMLNETEKDFQVLEKLMFRQVIDLRRVPCDFVYTADRLMLEFMVHAMLFHVERMAIQSTKSNRDDETNDETKIPFLSTREFLLRYLPLLKSGNVSPRFKRHYAMRLCQYYDWDQESFRREREMFYEHEKTARGVGGTSKPSDPWEIFAKSNMIEEIIWYLINVSGHRPDVLFRFMSQIQRVESKLSTQQLARVLRQIQWSDPWFQQMFEHPSPWSQRAREESDVFLQLGRSQGIIHVKRKKVEVPCFQKVLGRARNEEPAQKLIISLVGPFQYKMQIYFPTQEHWELVKDISATINFFNVESVPLEFLRRYVVNLQVRMIETNCLCGKQDMYGPRYEGSLKASGIRPMLEAIKNPISVELPGILTRRDWIEAHEASCSMRFVVTVSLGCVPQKCD